MADPQTARRLTELEGLFASFLRAQADTQRQVDRTSREMSEFKDEMSEFKDEMSGFKKEMNRRWGELANRLGSMAEDLVAPSVPHVLRDVTGCPKEMMEFSGVRVVKWHAEDRSRSQEFDVVAVCGGYVLVSETTSRLKPQDVSDFLALMEDIRGFFPEYSGKKILGALATLHGEAGVIRMAEKKGILVLGLGEDLMDVKSPPGFKPREF